MSGYVALARNRSITVFGAPPGFIASAASKVASGGTTSAAPASGGTTSPIAPGLVLMKGNSGPEVKWLQNTLNTAWGFSLKVDGDFGSKTESAVKKFQKSRGIIQSGRVDEATLAALTAVGPPQSTSSSSPGGFVGPPVPQGWVDPSEAAKKAEAVAAANDAALKAQAAATAASAAANAAPASAPAAIEAAKAQMSANAAQAAATQAVAAPTAQAATQAATQAVSSAQAAAVSTGNAANAAGATAPAAAQAAMTAANAAAATNRQRQSWFTRPVLGPIPGYGVVMIGVGSTALLGILAKVVLSSKSG